MDGQVRIRATSALAHGRGQECGRTAEINFECKLQAAATQRTATIVGNGPIHPGPLVDPGRSIAQPGSLAPRHV